MRLARAIVMTALLAAASLGPSAVAKDDTPDAINALRDATDGKIRLALIGRLAATKSPRAAEVLRDVARDDASAEVRVAAATGLASFGCETAKGPLGELLLAGGIREVRRQAALGMSTQGGGLEWTLRRIESRETSDLTRLLLVSSLADFPSLDAAAAIEKLTETPATRGAALRALARHALGRGELPRVALALLAGPRDAETTLAILDACDGVCDAELRGVLPQLEKDEDARVKAAASWIARRAAAAAAEAERQRVIAENAHKAKDGYAPDPVPPPPAPAPPVRPRAEHVLVFDATGSMQLGHKRRLPDRYVKDAAEREASRDTSWRNAWVAMQDTRREASDPHTVYISPVFDASALRGFEWRLTSVGVDTEGIEVGAVLREVLDRFEWRPGAERRIVVVCDNYAGDVDLAARTAAVHRAADGLTLDVQLVAGMGQRRTETWETIARAGGGTVRGTRGSDDEK
jgi:hypothetical protein